MTRQTLPLHPAPTMLSLRSLPCRVCGATSDAPVVILPDGPSAYCSIAHAVTHGWPWLSSEADPPPVVGQGGLFDVPDRAGR